ncbi:hypothetical protein EYF80_052321 [Liparis tanakae]|uniref:Uncharacterized protein n=1 Tax=Liparis tanakae TaxID=230148 RepID=A0A4Z2F9H4_9TELE|nr:hypothetical protein EYF80_052321 [Liparis tanakae]
MGTTTGYWGQDKETPAGHIIQKEWMREERGTRGAELQRHTRGAHQEGRNGNGPEQKDGGGGN